MEKNEFTFNSPIGDLLIECSNKGVTKVKFLKDDDKKDDLQNDSPNSNQHVNSITEWLKVYFEDPRKTETMAFPPLDLDVHSKKGFICKVWQILKKRVGPGETISYGELAKLCGNQKAARAVGQAMRTNPFSILVPCHRVITGKGQLGNYSAGVEKKKWLLKHEGKDF